MTLKPKTLERNSNIIKAGQTVWLEVHGAGVCSYEEHKVECVTEDKVVLVNLEHTIFDKDSLKAYGVFGFWFKILLSKPSGFVGNR